MNTKIFWVALARLDKPAIWVARELGVNQATVSRWVRGWHPVPLNFRSRLAEVLEVPEAELFSAEAHSEERS